MCDSHAVTMDLPLNVWRGEEIDRVDIDCG